MLIAGFLALVVAQLVLFIWQFAGRDPAAVLYLYESVPGILLLILRVILCGWFALSLRVRHAPLSSFDRSIGAQCLSRPVLRFPVRSFNAEDDAFKKKFYLNFGTVFGVWFVALVVVVCIGAGVSAMYREASRCVALRRLSR